MGFQAVEAQQQVQPRHVAGEDEQVAGADDLVRLDGRNDLPFAHDLGQEQVRPICSGRRRTV
ncbi:MAG: hypothetical protein Q8M01_02860 [Rubrivivax sp.]|nr:hypothetical protein [Rubrivivax sp.]